ncbi:JAB domain-containing protein [Flavivirga aquimarina]|uniref:JAB domain-containing protein n=1 Tax=Flavivirga aquimarina TaxID=2027862 RepID=A0ABT8WBI0_9FLAO|nr:JAB domain-containing protein [Flavivirga aquimarina]MDO5970392.1 JAB domain-containing protein [Flavivirga aquimarina]
MNVRISKDENTRIEDSYDIARIMRKILLRQNKLHRKKEYFWTIGLNIKNDIEYIELLTIGVLNQNSLDLVEVFNFAIAKKCKRIILCHNHPSGDTTPSIEDKNITKKIKKGADVLNIELLDHLIICDSKEFYSFVALEML